MPRQSIKDWEEEDKLILVEGWSRDGLSNIQIAHNIGIAECTLYDWQKKSPKFLKALKKGKEVVDREVENALLKRALGYDYEEKTTEVYMRGDKEEKHVKTVKKQMPPDVGAMVFWLKNRKPSDWKDKQEIVDTKAIDLLDRILDNQHEDAIHTEAE